MAYGTKYRLAYTDNFSQAVQIDLQQDGYSGGITAVSGAGNPLTIQHDTIDDFLFNPILGTWVTVRLLATSNFLYSEFFTTDSREWKVEITIAGSVTYTGFSAPDEYQQPYKASPYHIEIVFTDQLGALRGLAYDQMVQFSIRTPKQMIEVILAKTDLDLNMREGINLYETNMNSTTADSVIDQCYIDQESYIKDADNSEMFDCYSVLYDLLLKFGAVIRQVDNEWHIWRPSEATAAYQRRLWTWNSGTKQFAYTSTASYDPRLTTTQEPETHADRVRVMNRGSMMIIPPWKQYTLRQTYTIRDNVVLNSDFEDWLSTTQPSNWSKVGTITTTQLQDKCKIAAQTVLDLNDYILSVIDTVDQTATQKIRFNLNLLTSVVPSTTLSIYFQVLLVGSSTFYWDFTDDTWSASVKTFTQDFTARAETIEFEFESAAISPGFTSGSIFVRIIQPVCSNTASFISVDLCTVQFLLASGADFTDSKYEMVTINADNNFIPPDLEIKTADIGNYVNLKNVFASGMYTDILRTTRTSAWGDSSALLLDVLKEIIANQYEQPIELLTVNMYSKLIKGDSTIVESDHSSNKYHINRMQYDQKQGIYRVELTQLYTTGFLLMESGDQLLQEDGSSLFII